MSTTLRAVAFGPANYLCAFQRFIPFHAGLRLYVLLFLFVSSGAQLFAQNAIVGAGFAPGWGGACGTNTDFQYFSQGAGSSWIRTTQANGSGQQYFRLGVDWDGQRRQHTLTPGADVQVQPGVAYTLNNTCATGGAMYIDVPNAAHQYVFKTFNAGVNPQYRMVFFQIEGTIRTITQTSQPAVVHAGVPAPITATLSGALAAGQGVYLRYSTDAFATSTIVAMSGAGNTYTANIPAFMQGTEVKYYCFTSGSGLGGTINHALADLYTINLDGNNGLNYGYTVAAAPVYRTIAPGNWSDAATWENGAIPNALTHDAHIRHAVQANGNVAVNNLTIDGGSALAIMPGSALTIASGGTLTNTGMLAPTGKLVFAGAGTLTNAAQLFEVEVNGPVQLSGSTILSQLEIRTGGSLVANSNPAYGGGSTLFINTAGAAVNGAEWTPASLPHHVLIGPGTTYTLCSALFNAAFRTLGNVTIQSGGSLLADPLCNGNSPVAPGPFVSVDFLTIGGQLTVAPAASFTVQNGDLGSLKEGTRFQTVVKGQVQNEGSITLNSHIGDDLFVGGNFISSGSFSPGGNSSAGTNPVTKDDGRALFLNGIAPQTISAQGADLHYLIVNNPAGITLQSNLVVSRGVGLEQGRTNLNGFTLLLGTLYQNAGNTYTLGRLYNSNAGAYVYGGTFARYISHKEQPTGDDEQVAPNLGQPYGFPVGTASYFRPLGIVYTAYPSASGVVMVTHNGEAGAITGAQPGLTDVDGTLITQYYPDALWTVQSSMPNQGTFSVGYTCTQCQIGLNSPERIRAIRRADASGPWSLPGLPGPATVSNTSPTVSRIGLTGFSQFAVGFDPAILPVRLQSFSGVRTPAGNQLRWVSSSEVRFSHYELQQSYNGTTWNMLARINGQAANNGPHHYAHTHEKVSGTHYYRLRMVDLDGNATLSHVVLIKNDAPVQNRVLDARYVPATYSLRIGWNGAPGQKVSVTDMHGRVITSLVMSGQPQYEINTAGWASGIYVVFSGSQSIKVWIP